MKTMIFILIAMCSSFNGFSQDAAFTKVLVQNNNSKEAGIVFTVAREVNVRHYRLEGSNDSINFEVVTTIPARGNSMLPVNYTVDIQPEVYTYYRIAKVGMDATMPYSAVLVNKASIPQQHKPDDYPLVPIPNVATIR